jgi:hypothetical protein
VDNVQPGNVLALVSGVLQARHHGLQKVEMDTNDLISNYEEFRSYFLPYRAHFRFHLEGNSLLVTMEDLQSPGRGTWNPSLIPANATEGKLIALMVEQLNAANRQSGPVSTAQLVSTEVHVSSERPDIAVTKPMSPVVRLENAKVLVFDLSPSIGNGVYQCAEGLCAISKDGLWGFIDYHGNLVLDFRYPSTGTVPHFSHGVCAVGFRDSKAPNSVGYIFIDKKGNTLFGKKVFAYAHPFVGQATTVRLLEKVDFYYAPAILDFHGPLLRYSLPNLDSGEAFSDGLIKSTTNFVHRRMGFLNEKMQWVVPETYDGAQAFSEGIAWVATRQPGAVLKWGAINTKGKVVIPFNFSKEPEPFSEGLAIVHCSDNTIGYVDASGKAAIPCQYTFAGRFVNANAYVIERDPHNPDNTIPALIDKQGNVITEWHNSNNNSTLGELRDDGTYHITAYQGDGNGNGLLDSGWNLLVPPLFESIGLFPSGDADGLAWAVYREKGGKSHQGFIDRHGEFVLLQQKSTF